MFPHASPKHAFIMWFSITNTQLFIVFKTNTFCFSTKNNHCLSCCFSNKKNESEFSFIDCILYEWYSRFREKNTYFEEKKNSANINSVRIKNNHLVGDCEKANVHLSTHPYGSRDCGYFKCQKNMVSPIHIHGCHPHLNNYTRLISFETYQYSCFLSV